MISRLHEFINERRFAMAFQPIVESHSRATIGYESLVRCQVPGMESPPALFGAAVRMGLEERISQMCREEAVRALSQRPGRELLFVNTHPNEYLGPDLIESLIALQPLAGARKLVLEVHESAVPDIGTMRTFRESLRDADIALAYDDFGAWQSRLLELSEAPPDYLKFDRSLVKNIGIASATQQSLVQSLLKVASENGITTLAEGLDDDATVDACCQMGFELLQGYHLGRPKLVDQLD
jgi:EAL domain-containing protein (putative c-di-GMP-specific phosphodiesterase class I)